MSHAHAIEAAAIVRDSGGSVIGRTRLQKIAYLLSITDMLQCFCFAYKHYGPYSEDLAIAAHSANILGLLTEKEQVASWGGTYSIYTIPSSLPYPNSSPEPRVLFATMAANADAIELELAATAAFLAGEGYSDPWSETERRKPEKANDGRIEKAKSLYRKLQDIRTPKPLPKIV